MRHVRTHCGFTIVLHGYWSDAAKSNVYDWHVEHGDMVAPMSGRATDFIRAHRQAVDAINEWVGKRKKG